MQTNRNYSAVIFDLDGTLIDSAPSILQCYKHILQEEGITPVVPLNDSLIGPPLRQTLTVMTAIDDDPELDRLTDRFKALYDAEGYRASRVYDGIHDVLEALHSMRIPMAIATNKRRVPTLRILEHLRWSHYFRIAGTLDTPVPPHVGKAALLTSILPELGLDPGSALYVGDKREDGEAATANHMPFAAATWGYGNWGVDDLPDGWMLLHSPLDIIDCRNHRTFTSWVPAEQ